MMKRFCKLVICALMTISFVLNVNPLIHVKAEGRWSDNVAVLKDGDTVIREYSKVVFTVSTAWADAVEQSVTLYKNKQFILYDDWTTDSVSFGEGTGFDQGRISVKNDITIDLNGHTIDRNLKQPRRNGQVIRVGNGAHLIINDSVGTGKIKGGYNSGTLNFIKMLIVHNYVQ